MLQRLGNVIYWTNSGAAVLFFLYGLLVAVNEPSPDNKIFGLVVCWVTAALIWLAGRATRYVLAG